MKEVLRTTTLCVAVLLITIGALFAQAPNSFNYQAVVRNSSGEIVPDRNIALRVSILQNTETGPVAYSERHEKLTNAFGMVSLEIGTGLVISGSFSAIDWGSTSHFLKIEIDLNAGASYTNFGTSKMLSVPYSFYANQLSYLQLDPVNQSVSLQAKPTAADDDPIFEIKNKDGIVMLGVYNEGVRINVLEEELKGSKSGFAVGSFSRETKGEPAEIMRLTSDSIRFYIPDHPDEKSSKSGFAVGSFSRETKGAYFDLLDISPQWARIYIDDSGAKSSKSGFAVGSFSRETKALENYFNISTAGDADIILDEARILWYPKKEAFLAGRVLVEHPDSVGYNSWASGYQSKAIGDWSQALGFKSKAYGDYSIAIGNSSVAMKYNSFAFGYNARALETGAISIGSHTIASGDGAYAFGTYCNASGNQSYSIGSGAIASGLQSFSIGRYSESKGYQSISIGSNSVAAGANSFALGFFTNSNSYCTTVIGRGNDTTSMASRNLWLGHEPLFVIGNGWPGSLSNALTVLKDGKMGLQSVTNPTYALELPNTSFVGSGQARAYAWATYSDGRAKTDRIPLPYGLNELMQLEPQSYYHHSTTGNGTKIEIHSEGTQDIGLVAQEVYQIIPEVVNKPENENKDLWSMSYDKLLPVLIKAIQEQQQIIEDQQKKLEELEAQIEWLKAIMQAKN